MDKINNHGDAVGFEQLPATLKPNISTQGWTTLDWAKLYKSLGYSVIPIRPKGKKPVFVWKEFQNRIATDEELVAWFGTGDNNIGIVTGKISGLAVVDADTEEAVAIAEANGLADATKVRTSKGAHYYCEYVEGAKNFQKRGDLPDIDLRAEGGYVVAPPSIHESGVQYQWQEGEGPVALSLVAIPVWVGGASSPTHSTGGIMTLKDLKERLESLRDESASNSELIITICLLFYGLKLEDICELRITDIYVDYKQARSRIRKLEFFMPEGLRYWLYEYSAFYLWKKDLIQGEMLLPVDGNPIRLAKRLEDHGVIPKEVSELGRQCYADYLDGFSLTGISFVTKQINNKKEVCL